MLTWSLDGSLWDERKTISPIILGVQFDFRTKVYTLDTLMSFGMWRNMGRVLIKVTSELWLNILL